VRFGLVRLSSKEEVRHAPFGAALIRLELGPLGESELLNNPNRALVGCFASLHC
jgi:hypothetical protein